MANKTTEAARVAAKEDRKTADPNILFRKKRNAMQKNVDDVCGRIHDHPTRSLTARIRNFKHLPAAAKVALAQSVVDAANALLQSVTVTAPRATSRVDLEKLAGDTLPLPSAAPAAPAPSTAGVAASALGAVARAA